MWQKIVVHTAIHVIPKLVEKAIEAFDEYMNKPEETPVTKQRKPRDTTKIDEETKHAIYQDWVAWKSGHLYIPHVKTQEEFVNYVNESYGLNKSTTVIMKFIRNTASNQF